MRYAFSFVLALVFVAITLAVRGLPLWLDASFGAYLFGAVVGGIIGFAFALEELQAAWIVALVLTILGALLAVMNLDFAWIIWPGIGLLAAAIVATFTGSNNKSAAPAH